LISNYFPLLVFLIVIAAIFRDDFSFTLLYLFAGAFAIGSWWSRRSLPAINYRRQYTKRVFLGEEVNVTLFITNSGWLPIPWVRVHEGLPVELSGPESFQRVTSFSSRENKEYSYKIEARRRGYYAIGPLFLYSSDILGLSSSDLRREGEAEHLTVYPKIIPLTNIAFPSQSPMGTLRHHRPIFEDPTRVLGKRDYVAGDSLRRVDWKSTAVSGRMQVKLFEPSIALENVIFLNLNRDDYFYRTRIASTELAIVVAASMANWIVNKQQTVGLFVNGKDPLNLGEDPQYIPARSGKGNLMRILDVLARIQMDERPNFSESFRNIQVHLPWGTTITIISGSADDALIQELYQARKVGLSVNLILAGMIPNAKGIQHQASFFGIPVLNIAKEQDMDIWRQ
jgi:uncharacterized protein (DUF58 family)